jgi:hypothetical protein
MDRADEIIYSACLSGVPRVILWVKFSIHGGDTLIAKIFIFFDLYVARKIFDEYKYDILFFFVLYDCNKSIRLYKK